MTQLRQFPGCLTTSKTDMKTLQLHIEATLAKKPAATAAAASASEAIYHGNQGAKGKA